MTMVDITLPVIARPVVQQVLFSVVEDLGPQRHYGSSMAAFNESCAIHLPSND